MIRINLAKTHSYTASATTHTSVRLDMGAMGENLSAKLVAILILPFIVIGYEQYNLSLKEESLTAIKLQAEAVSKEIAQYGSVEDVIEDLMREKKKLNEQLKVIQNISQKRAFKLKTIITVQESVPDDLWLKSLMIAKDVVTIHGFSRTPSSVQNIVANLNKTKFVESAVNKELRRVKSPDGDLQEFDIEARVRK